MHDFYEETIKTLIREERIRPQDRTLVCCGGPLDCEVLKSLGFSDAVISNLDVRMQGQENQYAPYGWDFQDAEALEYREGSFDLVVAHSGLHHCRSPHRALLEMYRVARKGVLVFEPKDGFLTRLGARWGLGQDYEHAAVVKNASTFGGVANTSVPNYVFRWNRGDVEKTINSYAPHARHEFRYFYALRVPWGRLSELRNPVWKIALNVARPLLWMGGRVPLLANNLAFWISKPRLPADLQPWMSLGPGGELIFDPEWLRGSYSERFLRE